MTLVGVVRVARVLVWLVAAVVALWTVGVAQQRSLAVDSSLALVSMRAEVGTLELVALLVVAVALDRVCEVVERAARERQPSR